MVFAFADKIYHTPGRRVGRGSASDTAYGSIIDEVASFSANFLYSLLYAIQAEVEREPREHPPGEPCWWRPRFDAFFQGIQSILLILCCCWVVGGFS